MRIKFLWLKFCFVKKNKIRSSYIEKGFYISSVSKEEWNAFLNIRINNSAGIWAPGESNEVIGHFPQIPRGELWRTDWCLARSRDLWWAQGSGLRAACQQTPPGQGHALPEPEATGCHRVVLLHLLPSLSSSLSHPQTLFQRWRDIPSEKPWSFQAPHFHIFLRWFHRQVETTSLLQLLQKKKDVKSCFASWDQSVGALKQNLVSYGKSWPDKSS